VGDAVQHGFDLASARFRVAHWCAVAFATQPQQCRFSITEDLFGKRDDGGDADSSLRLLRGKVFAAGFPVFEGTGLDDDRSHLGKGETPGLEEF
jgi:hypothetical protein